ncbi:MAG TPA: winged helix-turn-helix domain-containing protein, partial [Beijerinckiaceae bacterium]|nr:winged helix-turn-helix domain-containing protein [Beijerinckiaceae bacterium]
MPTPKALIFGSYRLIPSQRLLLQGEAQVPIGSRALEVLITLVEHPGVLVTKEHLLASVWPKTNVHEANLRVHISGIR